MTSLFIILFLLIRGFKKIFYKRPLSTWGVQKNLKLRGPEIQFPASWASVVAEILEIQTEQTTVTGMIGGGKPPVTGFYHP